ncbi:MAG: MBOAT family O-acyltransferase [Myxococcota bacterium]
MSFHSLEYAIFFVVVFLVFWSLHRFGIGKIIFLLIASWLFYASANPWFLVLLLISTVMDYFVAIQIDKQTIQRRRKLWLAVSVVVNLALLGTFKYANFFKETFVDVANLFGADIAYKAWDIFLPAGISFYTFMTLSYTVDIYKREIPVERNFIRFAFFIGFFAHLVAGPIVRARDLLPQIPRKSFVSRQQASRALWLIAIGVLKKVMVADVIGVDIVQKVWGSTNLVSSADVLIGLYAYTMQIYLDFSAYSDIAIGSALLLGYHLPDNFDRPYAALSISNFWRRWHMTMSSFLRDYVYFPLGGGRGKDWQVYRNLFVTFFLIGLWHGANWNFALYGTGHALAMMLHRWIRKRAGEPIVPLVLGGGFLGLIVSVLIGALAGVVPGLIVVMGLAGTGLAIALTVRLTRSAPAHIDKILVGRSLGVLGLGLGTGAIAMKLLGHLGSTGHLAAVGIAVLVAAIAGSLAAKPANTSKDEDAQKTAWGVIWRVALTLNFVVFMRILFRSAEPGMSSIQAFGKAGTIVERLFAGYWNHVTVMSPWLWTLLIGSYVVHFTPRAWVESTWVAFRRWPMTVQGMAFAAFVLVIAATSGGRPLPFEYFQF